FQREAADKEHSHELEMEVLKKELEIASKAVDSKREEEKNMAVLARQRGLAASTPEAREIAYRAGLRDDPRISRLQILDMSHPLKIVDIYVRVRLHQQRAGTSYELDPAVATAEARRDPNEMLRAGQARLAALPALAPDEALRTYQHCIFVG